MRNGILLYICCVVILIIPAAARAELNILGVWKNVDESTGKAKSHIKIWEKDGIYYGKIEYLLESSQDLRCTSCVGLRRNRPMVGMVILWGMRKTPRRDDGMDLYTGGQILDTRSGKSYRCKIWQINDNKIMVREYIFFFYKTHYWYRVK
ncbi:MAG: hypothetical protein A2176_13325 [Spirochaetes bacterium RBG_13_51_14]|nr:MAG: hypothetical protein A2176_13325 [Spirochaetes bacterium RBG_13_51_14]